MAGKSEDRFHMLSVFQDMMRCDNHVHVAGHMDLKKGIASGGINYERL
jgi:hypothetical protein